MSEVNRTPDADGKVPCQYCGKKYKEAGVHVHEAACDKNPENMDGDQVADNVTEAKPQTQAVTSDVKEETIEVYIEPSDEYPENDYLPFSVNLEPSILIPVGQEVRVPIKYKDAVKAFNKGQRLKNKEYRKVHNVKGI